MQVILNDCSLEGQFLSVEKFIDSISKKIIPILSFCEQNNYELLKSHNSWNRKVTKTESLQDVLRKSGIPEIQKIKNLLVQIFYKEPYWEDNKQSVFSRVIKYKGETIITANCMTEVFFRKGILLSFPYSDFTKRVLYICLNEKMEKIYNATEKRMFLVCLNDLKEFSLANSFLLPNGKLKIEIRTSETHHSEPHFHISNQTGKTEVSIFLKDFVVHEGEIAPKDKKVIKKWLSCEKNRNRLVELWNYYHPKKIIKYNERTAGL